MQFYTGNLHNFYAAHLLFFYRGFDIYSTCYYDLPSLYLALLNTPEPNFAGHVCVTHLFILRDIYD